MNKEQQIEQMAKIINELYCVYTTTETDIADGIYQAGYRKIDENCAVITKAELKQYKVQAVREFADKLKSEMLDREYNGIHYKWGAFSDNEIDELLKEYE